MTINTRLALGLSAAALSLSLALAPAFAEDSMKKDDGMKKDTMSKDGMKKDDGMMKKDTHVQGRHEEGRRHDEEGQHVEVVFRAIDRRRARLKGRACRVLATFRSALRPGDAHARYFGMPRNRREPETVDLVSGSISPGAIFEGCRLCPSA